MLFENLPLYQEPSRFKVPAPKRRLPEPRLVLAPAQEWEQWAAINCCGKMADAAIGDIVGVRSMEYGGLLHCVVSVLYGGRSGIYRADAWQLIPSDLFEGETWCYASGAHYDDTIRERGDFTGLRLSVKGNEVICASPVSVVRTYPTVRPVSIEEAKEYEYEASKFGWRAMHHKHSRRIWKVLHGHPVVVYDSTDRENQSGVLLWKYRGAIEEYFLGNSENLGSLPDFVQDVSGPVRKELFAKQQAIPLQAVLF